MLLAISEKKGLVISAMMSPRELLDFRRRLRAIWLGWYSRRSITERTLLRKRSLTKRVLFTTWLTVETDTPAFLATSFMVAIEPSNKYVCAMDSMILPIIEKNFNLF